MKKIIFVLILVLPAMVFSYSGMLDDFDTALKLAQIEDKEAIVMFSDTSCVYCVKFVKETLSDETVQNLLRAGFVFAEIYRRNPGTASYMVGEELKEMTYNDLYAYFQIRGTPTLWFFTNEGALLTNLPGFVPAKDFVPILRFIGEKAYESTTFDVFRGKTSDYIGNAKIVRVNEEEYNYVLQNDPIALEYEGQEVDIYTVWLTRDESTAEELLEEGVFRVILLN